MESKKIQKPVTKTRKTGPRPITRTIELTDREKGNPQLARGRLTKYVVPVGEQDVLHVELEQTQFRESGANAGEKVSNPFVQKYNPRDWLNVRLNLHQLGYTHARILYAPKSVKAEHLEVVRPK